ncbi:hypothetical protein Vretimale_13544 [Volvox reticuliferus]|uniref:Uncharacterized protein n=1 Tax=Volvox reticuliferus TaxID=1737510 RepID=A0A8J4BWM6_9CHLO|nr:hypothetical protein Vretifemale_371 [Volvox reticuliferus]GIM09734.1 hypothetical protein Vretimale_13544 [Volvox reticuliferus]
MFARHHADADIAVDYVVVTIIGVIALCGAAVVLLNTVERAPSQGRVSTPEHPAEHRCDYSNSFSQRRKNPLLDAISPPAPRHRTSIDLLRRRYKGIDVWTEIKYPDPHKSLDAMELDTDTVAVLDCAGVNRILNCVPPEELENHRLVLDSFNWDLDVLTETEIMTSIGDE